METGLGGLGGFAEGVLRVTPGQALEIFVGGQGTAVDNSMVGGGGFNGGGNADGNVGGNERGGGGGASDVRTGGTTFNDRVIVAAGGGGACPSVPASGGAGGGLTGGGGPFAGTQTAGGIGASPPGCPGGEFGLGGSVTTSLCAGGGGGWYGGGGGCGAGGGSSYIDGLENGSTTSGLRQGDGLVILTFQSSIKDIPTLSEWGLISMAALLGIFGFMVIRRRQAVA